MDKQIKVERRSVYGVMKYYPVCNNAKLFARIARTTTLTPEVLRHVQSLGFLLSFVILSEGELV
jgi:hypothetical protein